MEKIDEEEPAEGQEEADSDQAHQKGGMLAEDEGKEPVEKDESGATPQKLGKKVAEGGSRGDPEGPASRAEGH